MWGWGKFAGPHGLGRYSPSSIDIQGSQEPNQCMPHLSPHVSIGIFHTLCHDSQERHPLRVYIRIDILLSHFKFTHLLEEWRRKSQF